MSYCTIKTPQIDTQIEHIKEQIVKAVSKNMCMKEVITSIVLGGGYGRGAGGVLRLKNGEVRLYNDLDLFVVIDPKASFKKCQLCRTSLDELGERLSEAHHVSIDFGPLMTPQKLKRNVETLMIQELIRAYVVVFGDDSPLKTLRQIDFTQLPAQEMQRLLLNRGAGLLFAKQKLMQDHSSFSDQDFILRNINKAVLAIGDVYLFLHQDYHFSASERLEKLETTEGLPAHFLERYREALSFKNEPPAEINVNLLSLWEEVVLAYEWMYDYFTERYTPCAPKSCLEKFKNVIRHFLIFRFYQPNTLFLHPREHLFSLIFFILLEKVPKKGYIYIIHYFKSEILQRESMIRLFTKLWNQYN